MITHSYEIFGIVVLRFRLYTSLMVSYFPRDSLHEDYACVRLSVSEIGDEEGAPWLPDRKIRIFSNPAENNPGGGASSGAGAAGSTLSASSLSNALGNSFSHHPRNLNLNLVGGSGGSGTEDEYYCAYDPEDGAMEQLNKDFLQMKDDVDKERLIVNGRKQRRSLASLNESERHIAIEIETKER